MPMVINDSLFIHDDSALMRFWFDGRHAGHYQLMMGSCWNPKHQANKPRVSAIASTSQLLPGTRTFACIDNLINCVGCLHDDCSAFWLTDTGIGNIVHVLRASQGPNYFGRLLD
ncbi:unnamed protein product [Schistocephalus solidus]|uniref:DUF1963 domain-containing protein n=1 Tax=Schistocephalus solidus TaxID=70667 RepID=A0A183STU0_SCHSO|nr:unnamed protein product [Schistocephalus solidus]